MVDRAANLPSQKPGTRKVNNFRQALYRTSPFTWEPITTMATYYEGAEPVIAGPVADQAALQGLLAKVFDLDCS